MATIEEFRTGRCNMDRLNRAYIVLIPKVRVDWGFSANLPVQFYLLNHCQGAGKPPAGGPPFDHQPVPVSFLTRPTDVGKHCSSGGDCCIVAAEWHEGYYVEGRFFKGL